MNTRPIAIVSAVLAFFLVCVVSVCSGSRADTACLKALTAAAIIYVIAGVIARMVLNIAFQAMNQTTRHNSNEQVTDAGRSNS